MKFIVAIFGALVAMFAMAGTANALPQPEGKIEVVQEFGPTVLRYTLNRHQNVVTVRVTCSNGFDQSQTVENPGDSGTVTFTVPTPAGNCIAYLDGKTRRIDTVRFTDFD